MAVVVEVAGAVAVAVEMVMSIATKFACFATGALLLTVGVGFPSAAQSQTPQNPMCIMPSDAERNGVPLPIESDRIVAEELGGIVSPAGRLPSIGSLYFDWGVRIRSATPILDVIDTSGGRLFIRSGDVIGFAPGFSSATVFPAAGVCSSARLPEFAHNLILPGYRLVAVKGGVGQVGGLIAAWRSETATETVITRVVQDGSRARLERLASLPLLATAMSVMPPPDGNGRYLTIAGTRPGDASIYLLSLVDTPSSPPRRP